jgi:hypothetical protein
MPDIRVELDETAADLLEHVRQHPDLVHDDYQNHVDDDPIQEACYLLAEAYFHARGGTDGPFEVYRLDWGDVYDDAEGAHWFLRDDDRVVDLSLPTPEHGDDVPWEVARHRAFITGYDPSNRTERVLTALEIEH